METLFNVPSPSAVSMRQLSDKTQFAVEPVLPPILSDSGRPLVIYHISTIKQNLDKNHIAVSDERFADGCPFRIPFAKFIVKR